MPSPINTLAASSLVVGCGAPQNISRCDIGATSAILRALLFAALGSASDKAGAPSPALGDKRDYYGPPSNYEPHEYGGIPL